MNKSSIFLTIGDVLAIHHRMIEEFGGNPDVRDYGLLESAVAIPASRFSGKFLHESLPAMAAAYLFHICKNHAFIDGNKRTAVVAAEIFLLINGIKLTANNQDLEQITLDIAESKIGKEEVTAFSHKHVRDVEK